MQPTTSDAPYHREGKLPPVMQLSAGHAAYHLHRNLPPVMQPYC